MFPSNIHKACTTRIQTLDFLLNRIQVLVYSLIFATVHYVPVEVSCILQRKAGSGDLWAT